MLSKYFIQRVYRKMGLLVPISVKVIDHILKTYKVEKILTELMPGNEIMSELLILLGFKFEKVFSRNEQKWQRFVLKKKEFYDCFKDVLSGVESTASAVNIKPSGKE